MTQAKSASDWQDERTITSFMASMCESNAAHRMVAALPRALGSLVYVLLWLLCWVFIAAFFILVVVPLALVGVRLPMEWMFTRYTLTNRRMRVDRGLAKKTTQWVPLEEIEDVRLVDPIAATRTGDLELVRDGQVVLRMVGIQDPEPARQTILDAVQARVSVQKAIEQLQRAKQAPAVPATSGTP